MDHFAGIFMNLQKRGKEKDPESGCFRSLLSLSCVVADFKCLGSEIKQLDAALKPWTQDDSHGKKRVNCDNNAFIIKSVVRRVSSGLPTD